MLDRAQVLGYLSLYVLRVRGERAKRQESRVKRRPSLRSFRSVGLGCLGEIGTWDGDVVTD